ncbi:MAG: hypothetical protein R3C49_05435 [Planctomycetaceae bacterium]
MARKWGHRRDDGGSMLATVVIIVLGAGLCCFLSLIDGSALGDTMVMVVPVVAFVLILCLMWLRYAAPTDGRLAFWHSVAKNHPDDGLAAQYRPRKVRDRRSSGPVGTNQPITAEQARDLHSTSSSTWVPSKTSRKKPLGDSD